MNTSTGRKRRSSRHNKTVSIENKSKMRRRLAIIGSATLGVAAFGVTLISTAGTSEANPLCTNGGLPADHPICVAFFASVPEISALEGTAALAVVASVLLLAWERRNRA